MPAVTTKVSAPTAKRIAPALSGAASGTSHFTAVPVVPHTTAPNSTTQRAVVVSAVVVSAVAPAVTGAVCPMRRLN